uniref:Uncharacterized protein n=1 Tax=Anguilla anguilla TaxID=7936 RepID=A0A0E9VCB7_ANGAN
MCFSVILRKTDRSKSGGDTVAESCHEALGYRKCRAIQNTSTAKRGLKYVHVCEWHS